MHYSRHYRDIFKTESNLNNTRNAPRSSFRNIKTGRYGLQTIYCKGQKIWDLVPREMKQVITLNEFKAKIRIWKSEKVEFRT